MSDIEVICLTIGFVAFMGLLAFVKWMNSR